MCSVGLRTASVAHGGPTWAHPTHGYVLCVHQLLGGNGYVNEYSPGRLLRDAKLYEIGAGTSEIRRLVIGRALFREGML